MKQKRSQILGFLTGLSLMWAVGALAGATFSRVTTWSNGQTLTASALNAEFDSILNNLDPDGIDDFSADTTEMRSTADPYPAAAESLATSLEGELERIRYQILEIKNSIQASSVTYWYQDLPTAGVFTIAGSSVGMNDTTPDYALDLATGSLGTSGNITSDGNITTTGDDVDFSTHVSITGNLTVSGSLSVATGLLQARKTSANQTITVGSQVKVTFEAEDIDVQSEYSTADSSFTAVATGKYLISAQATVQPSGGASALEWFIVKNGSEACEAIQQMATASTNYVVPLACVLSLTAGDVITVETESFTNNAVLMADAANKTFLFVVRLQ